MVGQHFTQQMSAHVKGTQLTRCATGVPGPAKLSDPQLLPMEFPQFGHCRGVTPGRVFHLQPNLQEFGCPCAVGEE